MHRRLLGTVMATAALLVPAGTAAAAPASPAEVTVRGTGIYGYGDCTTLDYVSIRGGGPLHYVAKTYKDGSVRHHANVRGTATTPDYGTEYVIHTNTMLFYDELAGVDSLQSRTLVISKGSEENAYYSVRYTEGPSEATVKSECRG